MGWMLLLCGVLQLFRARVRGYCSGGLMDLLKGDARRMLGRKENIPIGHLRQGPRPLCGAFSTRLCQSPSFELLSRPVPQFYVPFFTDGLAAHLSATTY